MTDDIAKETTKFKEPTSPQCQLALTLYRLAHGCSYTTVGDLFGVAPSTACTIFNHVIRCIVQALYDDYVVLPRNEEKWKNELNTFLENWEFPCVGAWDGFHVFISCNLKNFFSFKKRFSVTNMCFIEANKRFLWAGVGAPGSVHDSTLLQSSDRSNLATVYPIKCCDCLGMGKSLSLQLEILPFHQERGCLRHTQSLQGALSKRTSTTS